MRPAYRRTNPFQAPLSPAVSEARSMSSATRSPLDHPWAREWVIILQPCGWSGRELANAMRRSGELGEEVVAFVVDNDEGGKILDLDTPDRLHAKLGIFQHLDFLDPALRQARGGAADRTQLEPAVLAAGPARPPPAAGPS